MESKEWYSLQEAAVKIQIDQALVEQQLNEAAGPAAYKAAIKKHWGKEINITKIETLRGNRNDTIEGTIDVPNSMKMWFTEIKFIAEIQMSKTACVIFNPTIKYTHEDGGKNGKDNRNEAIIIDDKGKSMGINLKKDRAMLKKYGF